jgi:hypothetical protein
MKRWRRRRSMGSARRRVSGRRWFSAQGCEIGRGRKKWLEKAIKAAEAADVVILVLGESWQMSGEAASRTDIRLAEIPTRTGQGDSSKPANPACW